MKTSPERRIYELKLLYNISRLISFCTRPGEIIFQVLESLRKIIDYDLAIAMLVKGSKPTETILQVIRPCTPEFVDQAKSYLTDAFNSAAHSDISLPAVFDRTIGEENIKSTGESQPADEVDSNPHQDQGPSGIARRLNSYLNVPLMAEGKIVGMVNISSHRNDLFTSDDTGLIYALVSQIPSAIQKLEQMEAVERNRTDRLAEMVSEGVIIIDEDLRVLLVNRVAQEILGTKEASLKTIQDILGLDLTSLKKSLGNAALDVVVKEIKIRSESYQVTVSAVRKPDKNPLGFVISLRKSGSVTDQNGKRGLIVDSKADKISTTASMKVN